MTLTTKEKIARIERCLELWREIDEWPELDSVFMSGDGETDDDTEDYLNRCKAHLQMSSGVLPVIREAREKKSESIQDWLVGPLAKIECEDPIAAALVPPRFTDAIKDAREISVFDWSLGWIK